MGTKRHALILFLPAIVNIAISWLIGFYVFAVVRPPYERIGLEIVKHVMTYNFYWSVIQAVIAYYAVRAMGGLEWLKKQYSLEDIKDPVRDAALVVALVVAAIGIIFAFQFLSAFASGNPEEYFSFWRELMREVPLWSKAYLVAIAPFTAGFFEEIFWRGYGISKLEETMSTKRALILQAIAFGVWHGFSLHTVATALIGLLFGYVYVKRRRLLLLSTAHVITDIIGFTFAVLT